MIKDHKDLVVWQKAMDLVIQVYEIVKTSFLNELNECIQRLEFEADRVRLLRSYLVNADGTIRDSEKYNELSSCLQTFDEGLSKLKEVVTCLN